MAAEVGDAVTIFVVSSCLISVKLSSFRLHLRSVAFSIPGAIRTECEHFYLNTYVPLNLNL